MSFKIRSYAPVRSSVVGLASYLLQNVPQTVLSSTIQTDGGVTSSNITGTQVDVTSGLYKLDYTPKTINLPKLSSSNGKTISLLLNSSSLSLGGNSRYAKCMTMDNGYMYIGGSFTNIQGVPRSNIARISMDTGAVDQTWSADLDGEVLSIAVDEIGVYIGGMFSLVKGQTRHQLARLNKTNGDPDSWSPDASGSNIDIIYPDGNGNVYVAGYINTIGSDTVYNAARISATTGTLDLTWLPEFSDRVKALLYIDGMFYAGGPPSVGAAQGTIFRVSAVDGSPDTSWVVSPSGPDTTALAYDPVDNVLYASGLYTLVGGVATRVAKIPLSTPTPSVDSSFIFETADIGSATSMFIDNGFLYMAGDFETINGYERYGFARIDLSTGTLDRWNVKGSSSGQSFIAYDIKRGSQGEVYVAGEFSSIGQCTTYGLARIPDVTVSANESDTINSSQSVIYINNDSISVDIKGTSDTWVTSFSNQYI